MTDDDIDDDLPTSASISSSLKALAPPREADGGASPKRPLPPAVGLALAVLEDALGPRTARRVRLSGRAFLAIVEVPDVTWFEPLRVAVRRSAPKAKVMTYDAGAKRVATFETSVDAVIEALADGRAVFCISQDVAVAVPRQMPVAADARATLDPPSPAQVARVIGVMRSDAEPLSWPDDLGRGLGLLEIAACLRPGEPGRTMVRRIRRAMASTREDAVDSVVPRLEDLHGYGDVADWGMRLADDVARYRAGELAWSEVSRPAVLHGPPGTGKTLFARALARSMEAPVEATSVGAWFQAGTGDLGATIRAATAAFNEARLAARTRGAAVLFVDELDSLPNRAALNADPASWWRPVVNHVLTLVDGAASSMDGVVLLAATNDLSAVDGALLRPGRFGTQLTLGAPGLEDLARIVRHHLGEVPDVDAAALVEVLRPLAGATQARAAAWAGEARRRARSEGRPVTVADVSRVALPAGARHPAELRRAAMHEAGHAVGTWALAPGRLVLASLHGDADVGGVTVTRAREVRMLTRAEIEDDVTVLLCGRAAEVVLGEGATTGAGATGAAAATSDLGHATRLLTDLHASQGLGATLRMRSGGGDLADVVEADLQRLMRRAEGLVGERAATVLAVADALLARRHLTGEEVGRIAVPTSPDGTPPAAA